MNRQKRIELKGKIAEFLVKNGIELAGKASNSVDAKLVSDNLDFIAIDSFFTEYTELQTALLRVYGLIKYSLGPTRDVKTPHLVEALQILTELIDSPIVNDKEGSNV